MLLELWYLIVVDLSDYTESQIRSLLSEADEFYPENPQTSHDRLEDGPQRCLGLKLLRPVSIM